MTSFDDLERAKFRSDIYKTLASAFSSPQADTEGLHAKIVDAYRSLRPIEDKTIDAHGPENSPLPELDREYLRLFVGPGHVPCPPYESSHRKDRPGFEKGLVMGPSTADVRRRYAEANLKLSDKFTDLPDHITVEMEFMHFLCAEELKAREQGDVRESAARRNMQIEFFREHLKTWVENFGDCVVKSTNSHFYRDSANLLKAFARNEAGYLLGSEPT